MALDGDWMSAAYIAIKVNKSDFLSLVGPLGNSCWPPIPARGKTAFPTNATLQPKCQGCQGCAVGGGRIPADCQDAPKI